MNPSPPLTHIHAYIRTHVRARTDTHTHTHTRARRHRQTHAHKHRHTHTHTDTDTYRHTHTHTAAREHRSILPSGELNAISQGAKAEKTDCNVERHSRSVLQSTASVLLLLHCNQKHYPGAVHSVTSLKGRQQFYTRTYNAVHYTKREHSLR
jgi:hypothetical protein